MPNNNDSGSPRSKAAALQQECEKLSIRCIRYDEELVLDFEQLKGAGAFGQVFVGKLDGSRQVAAKAVQLGFDPRMLTRELAVLFDAVLSKERHVVQLLGVCFPPPHLQTATQLYVVLELAESDFAGFVESNVPGSSPKSWRDGAKILLGAARGLKYLHRRTDNTNTAVFHCDIKDQNILVVGGEGKLCDFAGVQNVDGSHVSHLSSTTAHTDVYSAPEVLMGDSLTSKVDVYSLGVVLWRWISGAEPWANELQHCKSTQQRQFKLMNVFVKDQNANLGAPAQRASVAHAAPSALVELATQCVARDPDSRPTIDQIISSFEQMTALSAQEVAELISENEALKRERDVLKPSQLFVAAKRAWESDKTLSIAEAMTVVLESDDSVADAWAILADQVWAKKLKSVTVRNTQHGTQQCALKALSIDASSALAWCRLGSPMDSTETVTVNGRDYSKRQCLLKALRCDPNNSKTWNCLGTTLKSTETVSVNGRDYSKRQCYLEALRCDPNNSPAWYNLATTLTSTETVTVNGRDYNQRQCYLEALRCDPNGTYAWINLATTLNSTETVTVNGRDYSKRQCYLEALRCDPNDSPAWFNLGKTLTSTETVTVNGREYSKSECIAKGKSH